MHRELHRIMQASIMPCNVRMCRLASSTGLVILVHDEPEPTSCTVIEKYRLAPPGANLTPFKQLHSSSVVVATVSPRSERQHLNLCIKRCCVPEATCPFRAEKFGVSYVRDHEHACMAVRGMLP